MGVGVWGVYGILWTLARNLSYGWVGGQTDAFWRIRTWLSLISLDLFLNDNHDFQKLLTVPSQYLKPASGNGRVAATWQPSYMDPELATPFVDNRPPP
jgi:hypothetical protein